MRPILCILAVAGVLAAAPAVHGLDVPPRPWFELVSGPDVEVSLFCRPSGAGAAFDRARAFGGAVVDATLTIRIWSDEPGWGEPVVGLPAEDIWLEDTQGLLVACAGGTVADGPTDADGRTSWQAPLRAGGRCGPDTGDQLLVTVQGGHPPGPQLPVHLNSADLNGDGRVDLPDAGLFAQHLGGPYTYAADFTWDGVINLSDVGLIAAALGDACP